MTKELRLTIYHSTLLILYLLAVLIIFVNHWGMAIMSLLLFNQSPIIKILEGLFTSLFTSFCLIMITLILKRSWNEHD